MSNPPIELCLSCSERLKEKLKRSPSTDVTNNAAHSLSDNSTSVHAKALLFERTNNLSICSTDPVQLEMKRNSVHARASVFGKVCTVRDDSSHSEKVCKPKPEMRGTVREKALLFGNVNEHVMPTVSQKTGMLPARKNVRTKSSIFERSTKSPTSSLVETTDNSLKRKSVLDMASLFEEAKGIRDTSFREAEKFHDVQLRNRLAEKMHHFSQLSTNNHDVLSNPFSVGEPNVQTKRFSNDTKSKNCPEPLLSRKQASNKPSCTVIFDVPSENKCSPLKVSSHYENARMTTVTNPSNELGYGSSESLPVKTKARGLENLFLSAGAPSTSNQSTIEKKRTSIGASAKKRSRSETANVYSSISGFWEDVRESDLPSQSSRINVLALVSQFENNGEASKPPRSKTWNFLSKPSHVNKQHSSVVKPPRAKTHTTLQKRTQLGNREGVELAEVEISEVSDSTRIEETEDSSSNPSSKSAVVVDELQPYRYSKGKKIPEVFDSTRVEEIEDTSSNPSLKSNFIVDELQLYRYSTSPSKTENNDEIVPATTPPTMARSRRCSAEPEYRSPSPNTYNLDIDFSASSMPAVIWRRESSHGNLVSPEASNICTLPAHYEVNSSPEEDSDADTMYENPSVGIVEKVISALARAHSILDNRSVRRAHMCSDFDLMYSESNTLGWESGHLCVSAMISCLLRDRTMRFKLREFGISFSKPLGINQVSRRIEEAWAAGFDVDGAADYSGTLVGRRAYLGATEVAVLLLSSGIPALTRAFSARTPRQRRLFFDWVVDHFQRCCSNASGCGLHKRRRKRQGREDALIVPLFVSWPKRTCLVVGAERVRNGNVRLLVVEPTAACADVLTSRSVKKRVAVTRRGESHPLWTSTHQYHVVYVDRIEDEDNDVEVSNRIVSRGTKSFGGFSMKRINFRSSRRNSAEHDRAR